MGVNRRISPNKTISIKPIQKVGIACPATAIDMDIRSTHESGFKAAITPKGIPISSETTSPENASRSVVGKRIATNSPTVSGK